MAVYISNAIIDITAFYSGLVTTIIILIFSLLDNRIIKKWQVVTFVFYSFAIYLYIHGLASIIFTTSSLIFLIVIMQVLDWIKKFNIKKYLYWIIACALSGIFVSVIVFSVYIIKTLQMNAAGNAFVGQVINNAGGALPANNTGQYDDKFAAEIIDDLIIPDEIALITDKNSKGDNAKSLFYDFSATDKLLSLQKNLDMGKVEAIDISISNLERAKSRQNTDIKEYFDKWKLIKQEINPSKELFQETYLFIGNKGESEWIRGACYYQGVIVELDLHGLVDDEVIANFEKIVWNIADRLPKVYESKLRAVSEGTLFSQK